MKKHILVASIFFAFFFPFIAFAEVESVDNGYSERIIDYRSQVQVHQDSSFDVIDEITYDFGNNQKHGIYRYLQYKYKDNKKTVIETKSVNLNNNYVPFTTYKSGPNYVLKIGDSETLATGKQKYTIKYSVKGGFNYFENKDELYWQVTGTKWNVPINSSSVVVDFSKLDVDEEKLESYCYSGGTDSTNKCSSLNAKKDFIIFSQNNLSSRQGLTYAIGFPPNTVQKVSFEVSFFEKYLIYFIIGIFILFIVIILAFSYYVSRHTFKGTTIIPEFNPPEGISPLETGVIIDSNVDAKDISAEIIYFAVKGYIKITRIEKSILGFKYDDYELTKLFDMPEDPVRPFDKKIFNLIFCDESNTVKISEIQEKLAKKKFSKSIRFWDKSADIEDFDLSKIRSNIYKNFVIRGIMDKYTEVYFVIFFVLPFLPFILGFVLGSIFNIFSFGDLGGVGEIILTFVFAFLFLSIFFFRKLIQPLTPYGASLRNKIKGLKMYIKIVDIEKIKYLNPPDRTPERFEKMLPYAMVLGLEKEWAKQFEGIFVSNPSWYSDPTGNVFTPVVFADSISKVSTSIDSGFSSSASGSDGGGSVGGGGGGGGGGSW